MTNLTISNFLTVQNLKMTNEIVVTNADGTTVTMVQTGMRTVSVGPAFLPVVAVIVAIAALFLWMMIRRKSDSN
jgi:hypothetical protein